MTGGTPNSLHSAASLGDSAKLMKLLVDSGHAIDGGDSRRYTPFHVACAGGHVGCATLLRNHGADTSLTNDTGLTAWALAEQLHRVEIVALQSTAPLLTPQARARVGLSTGGSATAGGGKKERKSKSKRRESAPAVAARGGGGVDAPVEVAAAGDRARRSSAAAVASSNVGLEESKALKAELKALGLSAKGSKADLRQRLEEARAAH